MVFVRSWSTLLAQLAAITGLTISQVGHFMTNTRKRLWQSWLQGTDADGNANKVKPVKQHDIPTYEEMGI
jgi:hypothetical protein